MLEAVRRTIRRYALLPPGGRVVVALSGGPDSVALLHVLRELETAGALTVVGVAHFNHRLRGEAADLDERFCRELAASMGIPIAVGSADVRGIARAQKRSIEDAGRRLRYQFFEEVVDRFGADAVAVGHSRDDQAETFLLRLLRGAGTRGLGAIRPKNGRVIRPLIDISRAELRQYAADRGLTFREDETNADLSVPRNRIRHELLPYLERHFSPNIVGILAREADLARDDDERLQEEAIETAASVVLTDTHGPSVDRSTGSSADRHVFVDAPRLSSLHPAIASRVARIALEALAAGRFVGFEHIHRFLDFVRSGAPGSAVSLPGQQAVHQGDRVLLRPEPRRRSAGKPPEAPSGAKGGPESPIPLSIPGEAVLARQGWAVQADFAESAGDVVPTDGLTALVTGVEGPFAVRTRKPGDRFRPPGLGGRSRKLQDYLVDRKVPRSVRDLVPLVVDRDDRIVWIVGHAVAEGLLATDPSPGVILLIARHLGGEV
ncbi:MAG TPA: tRNA lysidine(34) synthetase TilS [Vicinamibacterales bacterium]